MASTYIYGPELLGASFKTGADTSSLFVPAAVNVGATGLAANYLLGYGYMSPVGYAASGAVQFLAGYLRPSLFMQTKGSGSTTQQQNADAYRAVAGAVAGADASIYRDAVANQPWGTHDAMYTKMQSATNNGTRDYHNSWPPKMSDSQMGYTSVQAADHQRLHAQSTDTGLGFSSPANNNTAV